MGVFAGLLAAATIWWSYFVGDDDRASAALAAASPQRRATLAITGYFFAHLVMIYGILVLAAGIGVVCAGADRAASTTAGAWLIAGGVAIFLLGSGGFRAALGYADPRTRIVGGACCLAAVPVGLVTSAAVELVIVASHRRADARRRRPRRPIGAGERCRSPGGLGRSDGFRQDVGMTTVPPDRRAVLEYRIPAAQLRPGDLVNTSPGADDDWQQVLGVYASPAGLNGVSSEVRSLVQSLDGRYVVVELTDLAPVDANIYYSDGVAMAVSDDEEERPIVDEISPEDGVRTYLYTKFELVTVRAST